MFRIFFKNILALLILNISAYGYTSVTELEYEGGISLYGKVGFAIIKLEENFSKNIYKMTVTASSTGLIKKLSSNRKDIYIGEGFIKNGIYVPSKFTKRVLKDDFDEKITYIFDYENEKVLKESVIKKLEYSHKFDMNKMGIVQTKELVTKEKSEYIDFHKDDFISLFLNSRHGNLKGVNISYVDKKEEDSINIISKNLYEVGKDYGNDIYRIGFLNDESIFFKEAVAEDIAFYGNAYIKKVYEKSNVVDAK